MTHPANPERFHALDATRAFALLLGVLFHAAWTFVPRASGGPIVDISGHAVFDWFFFAAHTFRMQLFFLIAGFFTRLLHQKLGTLGFAKHRLARIGLPFLIFWFLLLPPTMAAWVWGGNVSGGNLSPIPVPMVLGYMVLLGGMFIPVSSGGVFNLAHLWFLYYLLWLYLLALGLRALALWLIPESSPIRTQARRAVGWLAESRFSLALLTLLAGLFLWPMRGWFGVDTPLYSLAPSLPVLVLYGSCFALGWWMHGHLPLLARLTRGWLWQLPLGLLLSVLLFLVPSRLAHHAIIEAEAYPWLSSGQIGDWPRFLARLQSAEAPASGTNSALANLWQRLDEPSRAAILKLSGEARPEPRAGVCEALNKLLAQPHPFLAATNTPAPSAETLDGERLAAQNRARLDELFAPSLIPDPRHQPWYRPAKLAYSLGYAFVMWLLVFGTLGLFQARCASHSPAWRYVADSAYWIYLIHLPLVACLQVWVARWPIPAVPKFLLLVSIAFLLLFASYHYLVRSTVVGRLLNGRAHPFVAWPFGRRAER